VSAAGDVVVQRNFSLAVIVVALAVATVTRLHTVRSASAQTDAELDALIAGDTDPGGDRLNRRSPQPAVDNERTTATMTNTSLTKPTRTSAPPRVWNGLGYGPATTQARGPIGATRPR
jgi:hypothetical protein